MILCIDLTSKKIKIAGVKKERESLEIVESLELNSSEFSKRLAELFERSSCRIDEVRISASAENTFHKIFTLPNLKKKMLDQALEVEVTKAFGKDYQFRCRDLGEVPGPGNKVNRKLMTVGIKADTLERLSKLFESLPAKPSLFTTYPVALQALLRRARLSSEEATAFVELDHPTSRIVIFKGNEIRLAREVNVLEEEKDPDRSALAKDIYRTLLFYTETYPNEVVDRLVFSGNSSISRAIETLRQKTKAKILPLSLETVSRGLKDESHVHPGCLGLALLRPDHFSLGFIPVSVQKRMKIRKTLALSSTITLGILLIILLAVSRLSLNLKNLNAYHGGIKGEIKMKEDRLRELGLEFVSHSVETSQPPWSEILLEMAAVVPPGVVFKSFTLKKVKRVWRGEVTGLAEGSDEISSLLLVERLQNNFNQSPLFNGVGLLERELQGKKVEFKIGYQLDM